MCKPIFLSRPAGNERGGGEKLLKLQVHFTQPFALSSVYHLVHHHHLSPLSSLLCILMRACDGEEAEARRAREVGSGSAAREESLCTTCEPPPPPPAAGPGLLQRSAVEFYENQRRGQKLVQRALRSVLFLVD